MTPTFFALVVCLAGLLSSRKAAIYWQIVFCLFGAAAAITLPAVGGAVITPAVLFLPFLVLRAWMESQGTGYSHRFPKAGGWLALAVLYGVLGAFFLPRVFAGAVDIVAVDRTAGVQGIVVSPLRPVSGNITQSGYAIGALLTFLAMRALLEKPGRLAHFRDAVLLLAALNCLGATLNLAEYYLGFPAVLDHVRTAYALFESYEVQSAGLMRIHGTFSEAAAFSGFTLPLFAFTFSLWMNGVRTLYSGVLWVLLLGFLILSTSTTAYVGLAIYAVILGFVLARRGYVWGKVPRLEWLVAGGLLAIVLLGSTFVLETSFARWLGAYFQVAVVEKMDSASGIERGSWNRQAWSNFLDTFGLGVGLGSVRASSLPLVLLSNLGLIGSVCYAAFLKRVLISGNRASPLAPIPEAARQAALATLSAALVSLTVFDLGVVFYSLAAAASLGAYEQQAGPEPARYDRRASVPASSRHCTTS